jgi:pimeloyl-ACP methyl ester carboxylesterase
MRSVPPIDPTAMEFLYSELAQIDVLPLGNRPDANIRIKDLRRGIPPSPDQSIGFATLVEEDGVWSWEEGIIPIAAAQRRGALSTSFAKRPVTTVTFERLGSNKIASRLEALDKNFTPHSGLREFRGGCLLPAAAIPLKTGRILLFIHGTFSNNDKLIADLQDGGNIPGNEFLASITSESEGKKRNYDQVLAFDHYTVSRSPVLNAFELARCFQGSTADIDIICHSRGGLVTRWFLEVFDREPRRCRRAVFVGSPLGGTSLAAPDRIRNAIDLFTNVGQVLGNAFSIIPFTQVAGSLMQVIFSFGNFVSRTPLADAAVAMIPGLAAMSRVENNFEILALKDCAPTPPEYFAVTSRFRGDEIGWRFWKVFCDFRVRSAEAADRLIFRDQSSTSYDNDLVVDTASMTQYGIPPTAGICDFGETDHVYHTIYFRQPRTINFIRQKLGIA